MNALRLLVLVASIAAMPFAHASASDAKIADAAGFTQRLGATIPGDLAFRDESGRDVSLRDFFGDEYTRHCSNLVRRGVGVRQPIWSGPR